MTQRTLIIGLMEMGARAELVLEEDERIAMNGAVEDLSKLSDSAVWMNRIQITSDSGSRYIISQRRSDGAWCCSCPGFTRRADRECKHLRALNLLGNKPTPVADVIEAIGRMRWNAQQIRAEAGVKAVPTESARTRPPRPAPRTKPKSKPAMRRVDLIASGYDWECGDCCKWNHVATSRDDVTCGQCGAQFKVGELNHALQGR